MITLLRSETRICLALPSLVGAFVALCFCSTSHAEDALSLRVVTYNIHHGVGVDGKLDLNRIAEVIRAAKADLVALQEVD